MSTTIDSVCQSLAAIAPLGLAEDWDNVGLLIGDRKRAVKKVLTCLTVTPDVVDEAVEASVDLIVTHHPLPFRPVGRITCDSITGTLIWRIVGASIAVYSAHTAFDSAAQGINQALAETLQLESIGPINDPTDGVPLGSGRIGSLSGPMPAAEVIWRCAKAIGMSNAPRAVGSLDQIVNKVGFACGSGGSFVPAALRRGCDLLITGEATFHDCLHARSCGLVLGLLGHYHSERFAMERLADRLRQELSDLEIWASRNESDPIRSLDD